MDRIFVCQKDYIKSKNDLTPSILRWCFDTYCPYYLDAYITVDKADAIATQAENFLKQSRTVSSHHAKIIPVGTLDFVKKYLEIIDASDKAMTPLEIPASISKYLKRMYVKKRGDELLKDKELLNTETYFIKDISVLKSWNSLLYAGDITSHIRPDHLYSVSEKLNLISEWRVFVYDKEVLSCQHYLDDACVFPNADLIRSMVQTLSREMEDLKAFTLDIAVTAEKQTVPLEVHPFVSCGLYGFADRMILDMLEAGIDWYCR